MADNSWFPFQDVPGLLTPEMGNNVRTQSVLSAATGLLGSAGWSDKPVNMWQALGNGLQGGLQGYATGTDHAVKQFLLREQAEKLAEARRQQVVWAQIFGGPGANTPAAPVQAPTAPPPGLLTPPPAAPVSAGPVTSPAPAPSAPIPPSPTVWGTQEGIDAGLYDPPGKPPVAPNGPVIPNAAPAAPNGFPTQRDVRSSASGGLNQIIADMPVGVRQVIALAGPVKGQEILAQWVGKKAEKPSDTFLTVQAPDGKMTPYRADSPELDTAVKNGGMIVTTPTSKAQNELVSLRMGDGTVKSYRKDDPAIDIAISNGAVEVSKASGDKKPGSALVSLQMPDGGVKNYRADDPAVDDLIANGAIEVTKRSSDPKDHKPDNYVLPDGRTVLSADGRNYVDPADKRSKQMPSDALRLGPESAWEASRQAKVQGRAQAALDSVPAPAERPPAESPTRKGTGISSNIASATNAVTGGAVESLFGKKPFTENEANRNYLLNIRQVAKTALVNNPRFPVAEQKNVDRMFPDPEKFWANSSTEADKIPLLRNTLEGQLRDNNEAIAGGALSKEEISKLTSNNIETRRALRLLGHGDASLKTLGDNLGAAPAASEAAKTNTPPVDGARKARDGNWYVPDPDRPGKYLKVNK